MRLATQQAIHGANILAAGDACAENDIDVAYSDVSDLWTPAPGVGTPKEDNSPNATQSVLRDVDTFWLGSDNAQGIGGGDVADVAVASVETTAGSGSGTHGEGRRVTSVAQGVGDGGVANVTSASAGTTGGSGS